MTRHIEESIVSAGFGGQGIMVLGKVLANAGMESGLNVTYLPSYGAEVRGGTAHSVVRISSSHIGSPVVERYSAGVIMNEPSMEKFEPLIAAGGILIVNTSMVRTKAKRKDLHIIGAEITGLAMKLGNVKVANMIAVGIYAARKDIFTRQTLAGVIEKMAGERKEIIPINIKAVDVGIEIGSQ